MQVIHNSHLCKIESLIKAKFDLKSFEVRLNNRYVKALDNYLILDIADYRWNEELITADRVSELISKELDINIDVAIITLQ